MSNEYFKIGKLAASYGLTGELVLAHNLGQKKTLQGLETIMVAETKDNLLPYFIERATQKSDTEIYLKLEGIETKEQARRLTPKEVWLTAADFKKFADTAAPIALLNYTLFSNKKAVGKIVEVIEQPHQILLVVIINNKEALIPMHADNIINVNAKKAEVELELPDGLLELYQ
jgi:16S rRNA processing protein RimM